VFDPRRSGPLERVTAPPYDVISDVRRRELLEGSPFNVVHVDLAEGHDDPRHPGSRYRRAAELVDRWRGAGVLVREPRAYHYLYEMTVGGPGFPRRIRGLLTAMDLDPEHGPVLPHERVMAAPVEDRLQLLRAIGTQLSAVYGIVDGPDAGFTRSVRRRGGRPFIDLVDEQAVRHRLWRLHEVPAAVRARSILIADGHHRYATALAYREERRASDGPGPWDRLLVLAVDADGDAAAIAPFHRVQWRGPAPEEGDPVPDLEAALGAVTDAPARVATATLEDGAVRYRVLTLAGDPPAVRALHEGPLRRVDRDGTLGFVADPVRAEAAVRGGDAVAAWILPPTTPGRIRSLAARGELMPRKSTYFWPKPRTGMVMMPVGADGGSSP
jgi:uncharacterized protein (DUF1015 family)